MNILKKVLEHEVKLSLGCTEPSAVALACSIAHDVIVSNCSCVAVGAKKEEIISIEVVVDPSIFKNGMGVCIANANNEKGNDLAASLGFVGGKPELGLCVLRDINEKHLSVAKKMIENGLVKLICNNEWSHLKIEARVVTTFGTGFVVIEYEHENVVKIEFSNGVEGEIIKKSNRQQKFLTDNSIDYYGKILSEMKIKDLVDLASIIDEADRKYIKDGVDVNLLIAEAGLSLHKVGYHLKKMVTEKILADDIFSKTKILTSSAVDARMSGSSLQVMSSGGSGNQGIVAILVPYSVGILSGVDERTIIESIALSHLLNAYIKQFTGKTSPMCGCAIAAGIGATVAIVYQKKKDISIISLAISNIISDIAGILCDGAKSSCALKVLSSTESAIRSAFLSLNGFGISDSDGIIGSTPEQSICNLVKTSVHGMNNMNNVVLDIMKAK